MSRRPTIIPPEVERAIARKLRLRVRLRDKVLQAEYKISRRTLGRIAERVRA